MYVQIYYTLRYCVYGITLESEQWFDSYIQPSQLDYKVCNTVGQLVAVLAKSNFCQGYHTFIFGDTQLVSGITLVQMIDPKDFDQIRKVVSIM